jgi:KaiC/GvpD/RAD55 family RecA-like ATPase
MLKMAENKSYIKPITEAIEQVRKEGPIPFLYEGIKLGSFGYVFGPSKSGKTTFCENLALKLACGENEFLGKPLLKLNVNPVVLIISFEEYLRPRTERNDLQVQYIKPQGGTINNLFVIDDNFPKYLLGKNEWDIFRETIHGSGASIVLIDSLNRMCNGDIERGDIARIISAELKRITYDCGATMVVIHHTPKLYGRPISIDSLAGSHVLAQEADFLIGINRVNGIRYIKEVACRYKREDDEKVLTFEINNNLWIVPCRKVVESTLFREADGRINDANLDAVRTLIRNKIEIKGSPDFSSIDIQKEAEKEMDRSTYFEKLGELRSSGEISQTKKGEYKFNNPPSET